MVEFETWWTSQYGQPLTPWEELRCPDGYAEEDIDKQFEAWKAAKSQWIKCSDRMPEFEKGILVTDGHVVALTKRSKLELNGRSPWQVMHQADGWVSIGTITHWMPLPQPPTD